MTREESNSPNDDPRPKVVLLGASNVARGLSSAIRSARETMGQPFDLFAAVGHGRSYGLEETRVLGRGLPGILRSGIWEALESHAPGPTFVLVTDIGNDILYGVPVTEVANWIKECLTRLRGISDSISVAELPLESSAKLSRWKFSLIRSVLFPSSSLRFENAITYGQELNEALLELAEEHEATPVRPRRDWYGIDPIHVKRRVFPEVWRHFFAHWSHTPPTNIKPFNTPRGLSAFRLLPQRRRLFGFDQHRSQPIRTLKDGTTLSFF